MITLNRVAPAMPANAYQTYQAVRPRSTHSRPASCGEVDCKAYLNGWKTVVDVSTSIGRARASYVRLKSGRHFTASQNGTLVTFTFPAGQKCFAEHRVNVDRPTIYLRRGGDWRATTIEPVILDERDWVDDFANHQATLADAIERG
jgi:hypothetical protein